METVFAQPIASTAHTQAAPALIETHGLSKTFRARGKTVEAVRGVDLTVRAGEIFGFLGPNGAGKSTTMRMLTTLLPPTSGQATICGYDLRRAQGQVRKRIGYVSQQGGAEPLETGRENLVMQGRVYGMSKAAAQQRATELLDAFEMTSFADRLVRTYSGGQRRRLDVALGILHSPQALFLDEPTTGLDPQSRARIWDEVRRLNATGMTIFLTTHYMDEADGLCSHLAIIDGGKIVSTDTPAALKQQIAGDIITLGLDRSREHAAAVARAEAALLKLPFVRELQATEQGALLYVERGEEALPHVLRLLDSEGAPIRTVTLARPTLDDVFLRLTGRSLRESPDGASA